MEKKKKSYESDQLTGHFQRVFFSFSEFLFFGCFLISPEQTVELVIKVNQQSVLNLYIYSIIFLHRTITFNSVTVKNTQTEPQKYINK